MFHIAVKSAGLAIPLNMPMTNITEEEDVEYAEHLTNLELTNGCSSGTLGKIPVGATWEFVCTLSLIEKVGASVITTLNHRQNTNGKNITDLSDNLNRGHVDDN